MSQDNKDHVHIDTKDRFTRMDRKCEICGIKLCFNCHQSIEKNKGIYLFSNEKMSEIQIKFQELLDEADGSYPGDEIIRGTGKSDESDDQLQHWCDICKT